MPQKTIVTTVTVGVPDEHKSKSEIRTDAGVVVQPAETVLKHVPPGELVTLDGAEADAIVKRFGGEVIEEIADAPAKAKAPAK